MHTEASTPLCLAPLDACQTGLFPLFLASLIIALYIFRCNGKIAVLTPGSCPIITTYDALVLRPKNRSHFAHV